MTEASGDRGTEQRRVEIVHESLLTNWPRLVRWRTQDEEGAQLRDELRQAAQLWEQHGCAEDFLWTGTAFREYQLWRERYPGGLTELEEAFAAATTAFALRRRRRRRALAAAGISSLLAVAVTTTVLWKRGDEARRTAEAETQRATASKLLALGQTQLDAYPTAALAYATKALEIADSTEGRRLALRALQRGPVALLLSLPDDDWYRHSFSTDAKWLAASSIGSGIRVFPASGISPVEIRNVDHTANVRDVAFSPGSDLLATREWIDPITIWSIPAGHLVRSMVPPEPGPLFQRAGFLWSFSRETGSLRRWSFFDGSEQEVGRIDVTPVADLSVDPGGLWLAVASRRHVFVYTVDALEVEGKRLVATHPADVREVSFGPNGALVSLDAAGTIRTWTVTRGELRAGRELPGSPTDRSVVFDRTGTRLTVANPSGREVRIWDLGALAVVDPLTLRWGAGETLNRLEPAFAPAGGDWLTALNVESISFWPLPRDSPSVLRGHTASVTGVRISATGWIVSCSIDGTVRAWRPGGGVGAGARTLLDDTGNMIWALAVDPLGERVVSADTGNGFFLARVDGGSPPQRLEVFDAAPMATTFDRAGRRVAVGSGYFTKSNPSTVIRVWDARSGAIVRDLRRAKRGPGPSSPGWEGGVRDLEFAPDGSLYSAGEGGVRRWNVEDGTSEAVLEGVWMRMDLSDDGRFLLTSSASASKNNVNSPGTVQLHDLATGASLELTAHGARVVSLALDPGGSIAVTGSDDGAIRAGRVTGEEPHLLYGHDGAVWSVAVSPDGKWIASGGQDGTVRRWPMPDLSKAPLHTLPYDQLLAKLRSLTNLRVVDDATSPTGYKLEVGPFPGWEKVPEW